MVTHSADALASQRQLIEQVVRVLTRRGEPVRQIETHLSWILVQGDVAYKFKKAVRLDFADFSTLAARRFYCEEEVRLNRRLTPALYLGVSAITGTAQDPVMDGTGPALEFAVKLRAFAQAAVWSERIDKNQLSLEEVAALAVLLARLHAAAAGAPAAAGWGTATAIASMVDANLTGLAAVVTDGDARKQLDTIQGWLHCWQGRHQRLLRWRKNNGFIRECHGDLHTANILTIAGQVQVFDCIEFDERLRWIDVIADVAFAWMDLQLNAGPALAAGFLDGYLAASGDYAGVSVLRFYAIQTALVRCKVALLRAGELQAAAAVAADNDATTHADWAAAARDVTATANRYMALSLRLSTPARPVLLLMHGCAGSGKSTLSEHLIALTGAVRLRADVERKRMHGLTAAQSAAAAPDTGIYDPASSQRTYRRLARLAHHLLRAGLPVIVDASFLRQSQRRLFEALAGAMAVPLFIISLEASENVLRQRVAARTRSGGDASDAGLAVLEQQLRHREALSPSENSRVIAIDADTDRADWAAADGARWQTILAPVLQMLR